MSSTDLASSGVVLITTPGCRRCPAVRALSERTALSMPDVEYTEVSAVDLPDLAVSIKVRGAPTVVAFHNGVEVDRVVGVANAGEVERVFASAAGNVLDSVPRVSAENRKVRSVAGAVLVGAGLATQVIWLVLIGAVLVATGWYDRLLPSLRKAV